MSNTITVNFGGSVDINLRLSPPAPQEGYTVLTVRYGQFTAAAEADIMANTLPAGMKVTAYVEYVDVNDNPAIVDGTPVWTTNDEANITLANQAIDGSRASCEVSAINDTGDFQVTCTGDADLGAGVREVVTLFSFHVVAGEAVAGKGSVGEATPIA